MKLLKKPFSTSANILFIAILLSIISCDSESKKDHVLDFKAINYSENIHLFDNDNYPAFNLDAQVNIPTDSIEYAELSEAILTTYFDSLYNQNISSLANLESMANVLVSNYRELENELVLDSMEIGNSFNWEIVKNNDIVFQGKNYLSFMVEVFTYMGGAHGNTTRSYYIFDLQNKKLINPFEIFNENSCEAIIDLQKESLKNEGMEIDDLYIDGFHCDQNLYIMDKGIIFHYNQYELASYAEGPIDVFISFDQIKPYLRISDFLDEETK